MAIPRFGAVVALTLLCACSRDAMLRKVATPEADSFARNQLLGLASTPSAELMAILSPRLTQFPAIADSIAALQSRFRELGAIDTVQLLAGQVFIPVQSELVRRTLVYHLSGAHGDLIAQIQLLEEFGEHYIDALQIQPITPAMRTHNAFWHNLGVAQFVMLVCTLGAVVFTLWAAFTVARTPMRRRWLWVFVALLGATKISMNWTTGAVSTKLISVQLLSASAGMSGPFAPWFVSLSFPAGALLALQQRKRERERLAARENPVSPPLSPEPSSSAV